MNQTREALCLQLREGVEHKKLEPEVELWKPSLSAENKGGKQSVPN